MIDTEENAQPRAVHCKHTSCRQNIMHEKWGHLGLIWHNNDGEK